MRTTLEDIETILENNLPCDIDCPSCGSSIEEVVSFQSIQEIADKIFNLIQGNIEEEE